MKKIFTKNNGMYVYEFYLLKRGKIGYIVITCNGKVDFGQCMCCWSDTHSRMREAITQNREGVEKLVMCGNDSDYNEKLGVDCTFDNFSVGAVACMGAFIAEAFKGTPVGYGLLPE